MREALTKIKFKSNKGITLIALVITIIVLLILAGIAISMLSGENGLLQKATKAKLSTEEKQELESLQLAINSALIEEKGKISTDSIQKGIDEFLGYGTLNGEGPWEYIGKRNLYNIDLDGKITIAEKLNAEDVLKAKIEIEVAFAKGVPEVTINTESIYGELKYKIAEEQWIKVESGTKITKTTEAGTERNIQNGDKVQAILEYEGKQSEIVEKIIVTGYEAGTPGLYDVNNNLLKTWEELVEMGLNIEQDYTYRNTSGTMYYLLKNNFTLYSSGKKLIIGCVEKIGGYAFEDCSGLKEISISEGVTSIGGYAFQDCSNLTEITIPESVTSIGGYAFQDCSGLTKIIIPKSVTTIGFNTFSKCSNLKTAGPIGSGANIEFGWDTTLPENAFYGAGNLTQITIPEGITSIGRSAFESCSGLTEITIPEGVTSIEGKAFSACTGLTKITIPEGVTSIGNGAFNSCSKLTEITIPESVVSIGTNPFQNTANLSEIVVSSNNTTYDSRENCNAIIETKTNKLISGCKDTIIPSSVTGLGNSAFWGCTGLTKIIIPESIMEIGTSVFHGCTNLKTAGPIGSESNIEFCWTTSIPNNALHGCNKLTNIIIPETIEKIGSSAFDGCSGLTEITIPEGITSIEAKVFSGCSGLTKITIPEGVTSIGQSAFLSCSGLTKVTIDSSAISRNLSSSSSGLNGNLINYATEIYIKESITQIGSYVTNTANYTYEGIVDGYKKYVKV